MVSACIHEENVWVEKVSQADGKDCYFIIFLSNIIKTSAIIHSELVDSS